MYRLQVLGDDILVFDRAILGDSMLIAAATSIESQVKEFRASHSLYLGFELESPNECVRVQLVRVR